MALSADTSAGIAAIAACFSALAAGVTLFLYWREQHKKKKSDRPVVEGRMWTVRNDNSQALFNVTVRNQASFVIDIKSITVCSPKGLQIRQYVDPGYITIPPRPERPLVEKLELDVQVNPKGTNRIHSVGWDITDSETVRLVCALPRDWKGGAVKLRVEIEERAERHLRIVKMVHATLTPAETQLIPANNEAV
jgi:hypothetical protein